jgi:high-affinity Fe2+/Pb2+ permease
MILDGEGFEELRKQEDQARRRLETIGGLMLAGLSLALAMLFLVVLKMSQKQPFDLALTIIMLAIAVALFAKGLKDALIGRRRRRI